jgi:tetratricopeptide (TPR) repeat protein
VATIAGLALLIGVAPRWISGLALNVGAARVTTAALDRSISPDQRAAVLAQAQGFLEFAAARNLIAVAPHRELARVHLLRHDVPAALAALEQARTSPILTDYERTQLGRLYLEMGFWPEAFLLWQTAGQSALLSQAADELTARREYKGAAAAHATLVDMHPDSSEHLANLAKAILAAEGAVSVEEAMRWFERATELKPEARRSISRQLVLQGEPYRINERRGGGRFNQAYFWFSLAARVDPTFDKPEVELGAILYYRGRYDESAEHFRAATQLDPRNSSSWHQLGQAEEAAGRLVEAVTAYEQAVQVGPNRGGLRASLARVYALTGRCDAARRELEQAQRLEPASQAATSALTQVEACR